jgi:branched-chain amino acid transport system permease protein
VSVTAAGAVETARSADRRGLILAAIWLVLIAAPLWLPLVGGYTSLGTRILVLGLAATALNFLIGFTGVVSFGHAAYFGLGVYGAGLVLRYLAPSTPLAIIAGILLGGVTGTIVGALIARQRGIYFAMITIAFEQIFYYIGYKWDAVTGGFDGLRGFERQPIHLGAFVLDIQKNDIAFYYFVLFVFALVVGLMGFLLRSPFGRTLLAIRENERRARFLGISVNRHIWLAFSISSFLIAAAGALYALLNDFADPSSLYFDLSGDLVIMAVLGGIRNFWGPLLGAAVFEVLQDYISSQTVNWLFFIGLIFVIVVMFFPRGLLGFFQRRRQT